jgi:signal transduction histidine kinase/DNA-binding response OmpR family regulator
VDEPTNILVVDDLPEKLLVYRTILDELGQNLVTAGSGEEALRAVLRHDFAVILLDVNMPGMNGLETAALIRQRKRSARTPIIFLTAFADEMRVAEGYAQGAVDYISTPVVPAILRAKVRVFSDLYRMTRQVMRQAEERIALTQERAKREAAEEANRRLAFLAEASRVLAGSLDPKDTARALARLAVPTLADVAGLTLIQARTGSWQTKLAWVAPPDPEVQSLWVAAEDGPADELRAAVDRTLASGSPAELEGLDIAYPSLPDRPAPPGARLRSAAVFPLKARGRTLGALTLAFGASGRRHSPTDLTVAADLAGRAAVALDNARLHHEVQEADRQKNEFLSMLAHELRNPLAPIRNANEVLREKGDDPGRVVWARDVIDRQLGHLVRLVDDLLDVSRLTLGKIRLTVEPVALDQAVAQAVEATRPLIDKFRHDLTVTLTPQPVRVMADRTRLTQVFTNLLNNAAKYTDPGGRIWVVVSAERGAGNSDPKSVDAAGEVSDRSAPRTPRSEFVEVRVGDTGMGIASDLLPTVFELFTQANRSLDRSQGGLGVGLTLVRRLVEMHGGTVTAHSDGPGKGSEFVVRLPLASDPAAERPSGGVAVPAGRAAGNGRPLRVMVVDDNVDGAETLGNLLEMLGHRVRIAHNGPDGIAAVGEFDPDLVLLDIGLPGMDGYEVARRLRREAGCRAVLIAVSGYGRDEDRRMSREAGFDQHHVKPVAFTTLRQLLDSIHPQAHA